MSRRDGQMGGGSARHGSSARTRRSCPPHYARLCLLRSVESFLAAESERCTGVETGGVLAGFVDHEQDALVVVAASGPGPMALHRPNLFNRDRAYCQAWLDSCAARSGGRLDFVGEWHKHREPEPSPSSVDCATFSALAADPDCHLDRVALLITGTRRTGRWLRRRDAYVCVRAWSVRADGFEARAVEWLPDEAYFDLLAAAPMSDARSGTLAHAEGEHRAVRN